MEKRNGEKRKKINGFKTGHPTFRLGPWCLKEGCGRRRVGLVMYGYVYSCCGTVVLSCLRGFMELTSILSTFSCQNSRNLRVVKSVITFWGMIGNFKIFKI